MEEYEDASDGLVPMFVKHTEAMLDEIDRMVCVYSTPHIFFVEMDCRYIFGQAASL